VTGFGCVEIAGNQMVHVGHGSLKLQDGPLESRLLEVHGGIDALIRRWKPQILAVEKVFFAKNALSALKLGHVRGVVLLAGASHGLQIAEYAPTEIKVSVTGYGRADKEQIARVVQLLVGKKDFATHDASDALALAICHAHHEITSRKLSSQRGVNPRDVLKQLKKPARRGGSLAESLGFDRTGGRTKRRD
jgi:crossover junction endodeoxyribonuclease RuvC